MAKKNSDTHIKKKKGTQKETLAKAPLQEIRGCSDSEPEFTTKQEGPVILVRFTAEASQHQALARMESFYESSQDARTYLTLQEAASRRLCRNYQAFNLPVSAICEWLQAMQDSESTVQEHPGHAAQGWWRSFTNPNEAHLLNQLSRVGCFKSPTAGEAPSYLISVTGNSALPHEMLHALYFLHSGYGDIVQQAWKALSKKSRSVISQNFALRGYGEHVWVDEFQAYISEDAGEFGKKVHQECEGIKEFLEIAQCSAWRELDINARVFSGPSVWR